MGKPTTTALETAELRLPLPPSVNATRRIDYKGAAKAQAWRKRCWQERYLPRLQLLKQPLPQFPGPVAVEIIWDNKSRLDIDNGVKLVLDLLQRWEIVSNDRMVRRLQLDFGDVPEGCRVLVSPYGD